MKLYVLCLASGKDGEEQGIWPLHDAIGFLGIGARCSYLMGLLAGTSNKVHIKSDKSGEGTEKIRS